MLFSCGSSACSNQVISKLLRRTSCRVQCEQDGTTLMCCIAHLALLLSSEFVARAFSSCSSFTLASSSDHSCAMNGWSLIACKHQVFHVLGVWKCDDPHLRGLRDVALAIRNLGHCFYSFSPLSFRASVPMIACHLHAKAHQNFI